MMTNTKELSRTETQALIARKALAAWTIEQRATRRIREILGKRPIINEK